MRTLSHFKHEIYTEGRQRTFLTAIGRLVAALVKIDCQAAQLGTLCPELAQVNKRLEKDICSDGEMFITHVLLVPLFRGGTLQDANMRRIVGCGQNIYDCKACWGNWWYQKT